MPVTFTPGAVSRARELLAERPSGWIRLGLRGGGCSGLTYVFDVVEAPGATDKTFTFGEAEPLQVCIDKKSYLFLNGLEIDFQTDLIKRGFVFNNPNAKRSCSCGESFTV